MLWSLIDVGELKSEAIDWGWKIQDGVVAPIMTDKEIAPESLTKVIRCKCKASKVARVYFGPLNKLLLK